jgi:Phosphatidylglycerophosphate synthase
VSDVHFDCSQVVILADESADWKIAGLRQLERLSLALGEFAESRAADVKIDIVVLWKPEIPPPARWLPKNSLNTRVRLTESLGSLEPGACILTTRLFVARNGLVEFSQAIPAVRIEERIVDVSGTWQQFFEQFEESCRSATVHSDEEEGWHFLAEASDIVASERQLLRRTGKFADGIVSRLLNRPISRSVTRLLLKFPISPNAWTMSILAVPVVAFFFLVRGEYFGFVAGTTLFQFYNILDGCDGEIARAKYLDCEKGRRLDALCDLIANLIFILCLGVGLSRQPTVAANLRFIYLLEGVTSCGLIGGRLARYVIELVSRDTARIVSRHEESILDSGQRVFGRALIGFLFQMTKRDVAFFGFMVLAIAGKASWILHLVFVVSVISLLLALMDSISRSRRRV